MHICKYVISAVLLLSGTFTLWGQRDTMEFRIHFRTGSMTMDPDYGGNASKFKELERFFFKTMNDTEVSVVGISVRGSASLEGSLQHNIDLAKGRLAVMEEKVRSLGIPDSLIVKNHFDIEWDAVSSMLDSSGIDGAEEAIQIIADRITDPERISRLRQLEDGNIWEWLHIHCFNYLRYSSVVIVTEKDRPAQLFTVTYRPPLAVGTAPPVIDEPGKLEIPADVQNDEWSPRIYIKSNAAGWLLFAANAGVEIDIARHWSFSLPIYFSTINYFVPDIKFRVLAFQPEFRYWFSPDNRGWYLGVHFGCAWYNISVGGAWRYQDHDGDSPALGGGISAGYRLPLSRNGRWNVDFSIGAGVYGVHYDMFHNESDGLLARTVKRTYWGPDNLEVTFSYSFDTGRKAVRTKGGER